jgi:hypothetical protein
VPSIEDDIHQQTCEDCAPRDPQTGLLRLVVSATQLVALIGRLDIRITDEQTKEMRRLLRQLVLCFHIIQLKLPRCTQACPTPAKSAARRDDSTCGMFGNGYVESTADGRCTAKHRTGADAVVVCCTRISCNWC